MPSSGKVLYYSHDISELANKISQFSGNNIYTFFSSHIKEKPEAFDEKSTNKALIASEYENTLKELESYFDRAIASIT